VRGGPHRPREPLTPPQRLDHLRHVARVDDPVRVDGGAVPEPDLQVRVRNDAAGRRPPLRVDHQLRHLRGRVTMRRRVEEGADAELPAPHLQERVERGDVQQGGQDADRPHLTSGHPQLAAQQRPGSRATVQTIEQVHEAVAEVPAEQRPQDRRSDRQADEEPGQVRVRPGVDQPVLEEEIAGMGPREQGSLRLGDRERRHQAHHQEHECAPVDLPARERAAIHARGGAGGPLGLAQRKQDQDGGDQRERERARERGRHECGG
jgi:hypothetical protein